MKRILSLILLFWSAALSAAPLDKDTVIQGLIEKYGGRQITNDHALASGTIYYADNTSKSFTLTAKKRILRMDLQSPDQAMTIVRHDGRSQITRGEDIDYPNRTPRYGSGINLLPIFALLEFSDDQRFTSTVVQEKEGTISIKFVEGTPPGIKPPPFPQPKLFVSFSLDSAGRINKTVYSQEGGSAKTTTYQYFYDTSVAGAFLQPNRIICKIDDNQAWNATVDGARKQVSVPDNFFKILETRERMK